jgi:hypothetical protein
VGGLDASRRCCCCCCIRRRATEACKTP